MKIISRILDQLIGRRIDLYQRGYDAASRITLNAIKTAPQHPPAGPLPLLAELADASSCVEIKIRGAEDTIEGKITAVDKSGWVSVAVGDGEVMLLNATHIVGVSPATESAQDPLWFADQVA